MKCYFSLLLVLTFLSAEHPKLAQKSAVFYYLNCPPQSADPIWWRNRQHTASTVRVYIDVQLTHSHSSNITTHSIYQYTICIYYKTNRNFWFLQITGSFLSIPHTKHHFQAYIHVWLLIRFHYLSIECR